MVWQEAFPPTGGPAFDAETERERRLAAQARAGAEWALTALIARYQPTVVRYLTRLCGDQERARQLAERIFQRMERRLHGPHGGENLRLWLLRSCTEAGLDALRRPRGAPARLSGSSVAGLLTEQTNSDSSSLLQGGLRRLRQATGTVGKQARPLVWGQESDSDAGGADPAQTSADAGPGGHLDETLDRLDPRDALRHRLVRVTLAELPYGDAQCLALHLVAGLNQAEVAKSLGITNSAARKRIVHGLALFSERYSQAVESLGLPVELGFGDARPRAPIEPEPAAEPAPVVVPSDASDEPELVAKTPGEDKLITVNSLSDEGRDSLSGVSYFTEEDDESGETTAALPERDSAHHRRDTPLIHIDTIEPVHQPLPVGFDSVPVDPGSPLLAQHDPAPVSGGLITRVASDAIVGPIVDALPVTPVTPEVGDVFGLPGPRSVPLAYELSSNSLPAMHDATDSSGIRMNWLDGVGMMTPLSFESIAVSTAVAPAPEVEDAPLAFEAPATPIGERMAAESAPLAEESPLAFEVTQAEEAPETLADVAMPPAAPENASENASEADEWLVEDSFAADEPLALVADPRPAPPVVVPVLEEDLVPAGSLDGAAPLQAMGQPDMVEMAADVSEISADFWLETPPARPAHGVITRSLDDLWDELPEQLDG